MLKELISQNSVNHQNRGFRFFRVEPVFRTAKFQNRGIPENRFFVPPTNCDVRFEHDDVSINKNGRVEDGRTKIHVKNSDLRLFEEAHDEQQGR